MTARTQWTIVLGVIAALALGLWGATHLLSDELYHVEVGNEAPRFQAVTLDTPPQPRTLDDYKGRVVLLNVWATWCPPCREEMPSMQALHRDFASRGFKVVAVSIDEAGAEQKVRDFVKEFGLTFDVLHDPAGAIQKLYATTGVPENFVIAADGTVRKKAYAQDWNSPENRALIARLLDEAGAPAGGPAPATPAGDAPVTTPVGTPAGAAGASAGTR